MELQLAHIISRADIWFTAGPPRSCSQGDVAISKANVHSRLRKLLVTTRVTVARVEVVVVVVISEASGVLLRIGTVASEWKALAR